MNTNILSISGLTKKYSGFTLSDISFEVPKGTIVGLIGEKWRREKYNTKRCFGADT